MQIYKLDQDIPVLCESATTFPDDIKGAFERLQAKCQTTRTMYGLSRMEGGKIIYKAAAERAAADDALAMSCETFVIPKGSYTYIDVLNWPANVPAIGQTFDTLCAQSGIDPQGYCVEWYMNDNDVRCMIRLADEG